MLKLNPGIVTRFRKLVQISRSDVKRKEDMPVVGGAGWGWVFTAHDLIDRDKASRYSILNSKLGLEM